MATAGIDVGKFVLVAAIDGERKTLEVPNDASGHRELLNWLRKAGAEQAGMEASGGYEMAVHRFLDKAGMTARILDPAAVRAFAKAMGQRAKNDRIDAQMIARFAATADGAPSRETDRRIAGMREEMRLLEQIEADIKLWKTRLEAFTKKRLRQRITTKIRHLSAERDTLKTALEKQLRAHPDLSRKFDLLTSIPGFGPRSAIALLIHLPEIGTLNREQLAAIIGVAPYDHDSGRVSKQRRINGGRAPVRTALFAASMAAAMHWNAQLKAIYQGLKARGKPHKLALIACVRKLAIYANAVIKRDKPWTEIHQTT